MMNVDVYDTHVRTVEGNLLHFDIMLPSDEESRVIYYANQWLLGIVKIPEKITRENCRYRHTETAPPSTTNRTTTGKNHETDHTQTDTAIIDVHSRRYTRRERR
jgi:hypothetical protein